MRDEQLCFDFLAAVPAVERRLKSRCAARRLRGSPAGNDQLCFDLLAEPSRGVRGRIDAVPAPVSVPAAPAEDLLFEDQAAEWVPLTVEYAMRWVEENRDSIIAQAFRRFSLARLEIADLLQEAYLAALEAVEVANRKRFSFEACFRRCFSARIRSAASVVYAVRMDAESAERMSARDADGEEDGERLDERREREAREEDLCRQSLEYMTRIQREVWEGLLARPSCNHSIAGRRGVARQTVQASVRGGLARVREAALAGAFGG